MSENCPSCGEEFKHVTKHWQSGNCPYPQIPEDILNVSRGLLLAGSRYEVQVQQPVIATSRSSRELVDWLDKGLGWLSNGYTRYRSPTGDTYTLRTKAHPGLKRVRHMADGRITGDDITPVSLAVWRSIKGSTQTMPSGYEEVRLPFGYSPIEPEDVAQLLSEYSIKSNVVDCESETAERGRNLYLSIPKEDFNEFVDTRYRFDEWRNVPEAPPQK